MEELMIIKRDGKAESFSIQKIKNAIAKAFLSVGAFATEETMTAVLSHLSVHAGMTAEEIQNQVEFALMAERYYSVAKAFILYRQKHAPLSTKFIIFFKVLPTPAILP